MSTRHYIRLTILAVLVTVTAFFVHQAVVAPPDPGYGRVFNFLIYGFLIFLIWIPYNITCIFLDGNKLLGALAVFLVALTLGFVALGAWVQEFATQTLALAFSALAVPTLWILSFISFFRRKRRDAEQPLCRRRPTGRA
jgi:hypothetical protein